MNSLEAEEQVKVLGIESSCDETAAAVVTTDRRILAQCLISQTDDHAPYGGVVPELAARAHVSHLPGLIRRTMDAAELEFSDLDAIAVTAGPGLIGGVMVGLATAKALAAASGKPLLAINHLEGHALSARLLAEVRFPYLLLLISGGHCQILLVKGAGQYQRLGTTLDDAVGEAFDKTAKLLGLGFPGGPAVERAARSGQPVVPLPRPMLGRPHCNFSFAGLKTAIRRAAQTAPKPSPADLCASFQVAVADILLDRLHQALGEVRYQNQKPTHLVIAGGVAANRYLASCFETFASQAELPLTIPPPAMCTDNAAMIAWAGIERLQHGHPPDRLDCPARARWPLDPEAEKLPFAGVKA